MWELSRRLTKFGKFYVRSGLCIVPFVIFVVDDYLTGWHDHHHESNFHIILSNCAEDVAMFLSIAAIRWSDNRSIQVLHAECPNCHFRWAMHPKQKIPFCKRCGFAEPP